jgi:hypothetical protein
MTETRAGKTRDEDVISLVADVGEDVLRGLWVLLFSLPRRVVAGTLDGAGDVLHGAATMLGNVDPVDTRVTKVEKRLDSLEKTAGTRGTAPARSKPAEVNVRRRGRRPRANTRGSRASPKIRRVEHVTGAVG